MKPVHRWHDPRLDFRDLNLVSSLNSLTITDLKTIWTPRLAFTNALGPFQTEVSLDHHWIKPPADFDI